MPARSGAAWDLLPGMCARGCLLAVCSQGRESEKEKEISQVSRYKGTNPLVSAPSSPSHLDRMLPKRSHLLTCHTGGLGL